MPEEIAKWYTAAARKTRHGNFRYSIFFPREIVVEVWLLLGKKCGCNGCCTGTVVHWDSIYPQFLCKKWFRRIWIWCQKSPLIHTGMIGMDWRPFICLFTVLIRMGLNQGGSFLIKWVRCNAIHWLYKPTNINCKFTRFFKLCIVWNEVCFSSKCTHQIRCHLPSTFPAWKAWSHSCKTALKKV